MLRASSVFASTTLVVAAVWLCVGLPAVSQFNARCVGRSLWKDAGDLCPAYATLGKKVLLGAAAVFVARYAFALLLLPWTKPRSSFKAALTHPLPHHLFRLAYFTTTTLLAVRFLGAQPKLTPSSGDALAVSLAQTANLRPAALHKAIDYLSLSAGFHVACLAFIALEGYGAAGGPETPVQVSLAVGLLIAGSLGQHFALGASLQAAHDCCDILTSLCKVFVTVRANHAAVASGILLALAWIAIRLVAFGNLCLLPLIQTVEKRHTFPADAEPILFATVLLCLLFLNIYWFSLLVKSFAILVRSGTVRDAHVESGKEKTPQRRE